MEFSDIYNKIIGIISPQVSDGGLNIAPAVASAVNAVLRWGFPILAVLIVVRCAVSLLKGRTEPEIWGHIMFPDGSYSPINHWENLLGRAKRADVCINYPSVSKSHAVLTRSQGGRWTVFDVGSKGGVAVNGETVTKSAAIAFGDTLTLGGIDFKLVAPTASEALDDCQPPRGDAVTVTPVLTLMLITVFQLLTMLALLVNMPAVNPWLIITVFGGLAVLTWAYFIFMRIIRRSGLEIEFIAFLLTTLGFAATASAAPGGLIKQFAAFFIGLLIFLFLGWCLRDLGRSQVMRWIMSALGLALLAATFVLAKEINGARNWLFIGSMSLQPSELAKICFVYAGAATLDRLMTKRNLLLYILFSGACVGMLALMNDFGTAAVFFVTFVVVAFLRSGDFSTIILSGAGAGLAALLAVKFRPYVLNRFKAWRHVWDYADTLGYQQTRVMVCAASGGLIGLGAGRGWLRYVAAADTDLVFGMLCEEWGIIVAVAAVCCIAVLALFTVKAAKQARSSFFVIAACSAMSMLVVQTILNVCGSTDILPLTGVTFPFVSDGGSSMLCSWGLLAFVKACDTRPDASFAIKRAGLRKRGERLE